MQFNRELSWLKFNERVLMEAGDESLPILERLKFLAIFSSNLDEFFMVRVASIKDQLDLGYDLEDSSGLTPQEVFDRINEEVERLLEIQSELSKACLHELEKNGVNILRATDYDKKLKRQLRQFFNVQAFPVLTPLAVDFSRPFPHLAGKSMYIAVRLNVEEEEKLALVAVPSVLPRFPSFKLDGETVYVPIENIIEMFAGDLFPGNEITDTAIFRVTRNGDLQLIEEDADDLLGVIEEAVKLRKWGDVIRLEIEKEADEWFAVTISKSLHLSDAQIYRVDALMDMTSFMSFRPARKYIALSRPEYKPRKLPFMSRRNLFKVIQEKDVFLHHPYESFDFVVDFIKKASVDPAVLAIKQTLYRVSGDSAIVRALEQAAENGKQVTVLLELMARFDEENNINWAKRLENKGVHVIYGLYGLKTHSKITLVVRKEMKKIRRYVHLGTGNYNDITARFYTDMGLITCNEDIGADASVFFNMITGFSSSIVSHNLVVAPKGLRKRFYELIEREMENARQGRKAVINAKINSLVDDGIISMLEKAADSGVIINLVVRGICTLVPRENITVRSIVGEFLEHSRIYTFHNNGKSEVYLASADWMTRNLDRRVELMFPIEDDDIRARILATMKLYMADNVKAWELMESGNYKRVSGGKKRQAHEILKKLEYEDDRSYTDEIRRILK